MKVTKKQFDNVLKAYGGLNIYLDFASDDGIETYTYRILNGYLIGYVLRDGEGIEEYYLGGKIDV